MERKGAEKLLILFSVPCQSPVFHLKYPFLVTISLLTNNYFILNLDLATKTAVFFIFRVVFSNNNNTMVMQICLLNVLIIRYSLLLC